MDTSQTNVELPAYQEGVKAYDHGVALDDCPYVSQGGFSTMRLSWMVGWLDRWCELKHGIARRCLDESEE